MQHQFIPYSFIYLIFGVLFNMIIMIMCNKSAKHFSASTFSYVNISVWIEYWLTETKLTDKWVMEIIVKRNVPHSSSPSCRSLFKDASGTLDKSARFSALYRQDSNKLSNEDMLKLLADFRKLVILLWVLCVMNCLSSLADVLERKRWKMCRYRLYFGKIPSS